MNELTPTERARWTEIHRANHLYHRHRVRLETFLICPAEILQACIYRVRPRVRDRDRFLPLTPAQRRAAKRIHDRQQMTVIADFLESRLDAKNVCRRNGRFVQVLHKKPSRPRHLRYRHQTSQEVTP